MKLVTLLRHGKSDWSQAHGSDFERPLSSRGRRDAPRMGEHLARLGLGLDLIVSSPAERARQTTELFAQALGYEGQIDWDQEIYGASADELMTIVRGLPDEMQHVLLVGHNPGFGDLTNLLLGISQYDPVSGIRLPTAAVVHLRLDITWWREARPGCARLQWLVTPKTLGPLEHKQGHS